MSYKLLNTDGSIQPINAQQFESLVQLDAAAPIVDQVELTAEAIHLLELPSSTDGRAFSAITNLHLKFGQAVRVWIGGDILPDQVSLAFQCGASGVLVNQTNWENRGEAGWLEALNPAVGSLYRNSVWSKVKNISTSRAASRDSHNTGE